MANRNYMKVLYKGEQVFDVMVSHPTTIEEETRLFLVLENISAESEVDQKRLSRLYGKPGYDFILCENGIYRVDTEEMEFRG